MVVKRTKTLGIAAASMLACTTFVANANVYANTEKPVLLQAAIKEDEELQIETVQDFIDTFFMEKVVLEDETILLKDAIIKNDEERNETQWVWIKTVTEENYASILASKKYYDKFDEASQKQIQELILENTKIGYDDFLKKALDLDLSIKEHEENKENEGEGSKETAENEEQQPADSMDKDIEQGSEDSDAKQEPTENVDSDLSSVDKKNEDDAALTQKEPVEEVKEDGSTKQETVERPVVMMNVIEPKEESDPQTELEQEPAKSQVPVETAKEEKVAVANLNVMPVVSPQETKVQVQPAVQAKAVNVVSQSKSSSFVDTYLKVNGVLISSANTSNYRQILNSLSTWVSLDSTSRNEINTQLNQQINKTYQSLLQEAQSISQGRGIQVNTSINFATNAYASLCVLSASVFAFLFKSSKEKEILKK